MFSSSLSLSSFGFTRSALECPACSKPFDPTEIGSGPRLLDCGHSVCTSCLDGLSRMADSVRCPACMSSIPAPAFRMFCTNEPLVQLIQKLKAAKSNEPVGPPKCIECDLLATVFCTACKESFCETCCATTHAASKALQKHERMPITITDNVNPSTVCFVHGNLPLVHFCRDCSEMVCKTCKLEGYHMHHEVMTMEEMTVFVKQQLEQLHQASSSLFNEVQSEVKSMLATRDEVLANASAAESLVKAAFTAIRSALEARETQLLVQVHKFAQDSLSTLDNRRETVMTTLADIGATTEYIRSGLSREDPSILQVKTEAQAKLDDLSTAHTQRPKDDPIALTIDLQLSDQQVLSAIQAFGGITEVAPAVPILVRWSEWFSRKYYQVLENGLVAIGKATDSNNRIQQQCLRSEDPIPLKNGKGSFSVRLRAGDFHCIGVCTSAMDAESLVGSNASSWGVFSSSGSKGYNGSWSSYMDKCHSGFVVKVSVDTEVGTLSYSVNGLNKGLAFGNLKGTGPLYAAVSLLRPSEIIIVDE